MSALRIDGRGIEARPGETVLRAARRAGIEIPSLCEHPSLRPYGACRLCVVEVTAATVPGRPARSRIATACDYPALDGIEVKTSGGALDGIRRNVLGMLLARAPDSPVLRGLAERHGATPMEPLARPDHCVMCGLCARVCAEVVGAAAIGLAGRGLGKSAGTPWDDDNPACLGCGACDWICPTGILKLQAQAAARFRRLRGEDRLCRYARLGLVPGAVCALSFECEHCDVEQGMRARLGPDHPAFAPRGDVRKVDRG